VKADRLFTTFVGIVPWHLERGSLAIYSTIPIFGCPRSFGSPMILGHTRVTPMRYAAAYTCLFNLGATDQLALYIRKDPSSIGQSCGNQLCKYMDEARAKADLDSGTSRPGATTFGGWHSKLSQITCH